MHRKFPPPPISTIDVLTLVYQNFNPKMSQSSAEPETNGNYTVPGDLYKMATVLFFAGAVENKKLFE